MLIARPEPAPPNLHCRVIIRLERSNRLEIKPSVAAVAAMVERVARSLVATTQAAARVVLQLTERQRRELEVRRLQRLAGPSPSSQHLSGLAERMPP